ncbi:hypothetical protein O3P69_006828 [Scylla paramamosain]|uniref:Uncharacterized protein n=1 Tax=Scylla paramamosain TaxID=85552 RepID=A0AAW0U214_SCYPA
MLHSDLVFLVDRPAATVLTGLPTSYPSPTSPAILLEGGTASSLPSGHRAFLICPNLLHLSLPDLSSQSSHSKRDLGIPDCGHAGCDPCQRVVGLGGDGARRSETTHVPKARPGSVSVL